MFCRHFNFCVVVITREWMNTTKGVCLHCFGSFFAIGMTNSTCSCGHRTPSLTARQKKGDINEAVWCSSCFLMSFSNSIWAVLIWRGWKESIAESQGPANWRCLQSVNSQSMHASQLHPWSLYMSSFFWRVPLTAKEEKERICGWPETENLCP